MATIDILPLSVNGVKPPLNLLFNLFPSASSKNLVYPLDLASNPNYGHAIQFSVYNYTYNSGGSGQNTGGIVGALQSGVNAKLTPTGQILKTISLYLPDTLSVDFNHVYADSSMEETLGAGRFLAGAIADFNASNKGSYSDRSNFTNLYQKLFATGAASLAAGTLGTGKDLGLLVGNALKTVPNPQLQLLFKGVGLRTFQFTFVFTPASSQEAQMVDDIMRAFQFYSSPGLIQQGTTTQLFLEPPQIFQIDFAFTNTSSLADTVTSFFKNIGTNILTSQVSGSIFGTSQIDPKNNPAKIFKVYHPCVLKDIHIDYAPNGWASYSDGFPVQTSMTLTFQETDIVTKNNIDPTSMSASASSSAASAVSTPSATSVGPAAPNQNGTTQIPYDTSSMSISGY